MSGPIEAVRTQLLLVSERRVRARRRRRRTVFMGLVVFALTACTGIALAASGVFSASPAPPEVVEDFGAYATELGFHPTAHRAQLVAVDGADYRLYATPNREGTYCVVTVAPWRPAGKNTGDGGVCVPPKKAAEDLVASITTASDKIEVLVGRVRVPGAMRVQFTDAVGHDIDVQVGAAGFFIAALDAADPLCANGSWSPVFTARGKDEAILARVRITIAYSGRQTGLGCGFEVTPHGPYAFDQQPG